MNLFHFSSKRIGLRDRMARKCGVSVNRVLLLNYLPDANQIRNSRDVSREIVAGVHRRFGALGSRRDGGFGGGSQPSVLPEGEITANITIEFPDGTVQEIRDQMLRLSAQDR